MNALVLCVDCAHGAPLHGAGGCEAVTCGCASGKEKIIEDALEAARAEIRAQWWPANRA
ncbi:MAG: hypothetical protein IAI50_11985 [Candidatus Eremiobacteraeota bacterium]|nr:hypothetical protein [Candidatus Eremiobacteraeota bacterium]